MKNSLPTALPSGLVLVAEPRHSWQQPLLSHSSPQLRLTIISLGLFYMPALRAPTRIINEGRRDGVRQGDEKGESKANRDTDTSENEGQCV